MTMVRCPAKVSPDLCSFHFSHLSFFWHLFCHSLLKGHFCDSLIFFYVYDCVGLYIFWPLYHTLTFSPLLSFHIFLFFLRPITYYLPSFSCRHDEKYVRVLQSQALTFAGFGIEMRERRGPPLQSKSYPASEPLQLVPGMGRTHIFSNVLL